MFLFEYLVHFLNLDFTPRHQVYEGTSWYLHSLKFPLYLVKFEEKFTSSVSFCALVTMDWSLLKESSLNLLLVNP